MEKTTGNSEPTRIDSDKTVVDDRGRGSDAEAPTVVDVPGEGAGSPVLHGAVIIKDRFILEKRLGKGGMGQVFKARDLRKVEAKDKNPWVAIKFLREDFSCDPNALISLQREAKKSQQLAHPNVLTVYDFDRDGDRVYMTMEYLEGSPLSAWTSKAFGDGKAPSATMLVKEMAAGLAYAHQLGVVHSDLKPGNVFLTVDGRIKILDFGIARIMDTAVEKDNFDAGELGALTPPYASLEMLQSGTEPHPADDVYALGLLAYQLFTGQHAYGGKTAVDALQEGLEPERIVGIKGHQWRAINGALQLKREDRTASADLFLRQFSGASRRNRYLIAAFVVLALSSGFLAWHAAQPEGPAVPFGELPAAVQLEITRKLELGHQSADIQDWDGASRYFMAVYELHPRNPDAEAGLGRLADHLVSIAPGLKSKRQKQYLLQMITSYPENEYLANHPGLVKLRTHLEKELAP